MQTFLSESTFKASAQALDNKRLNKQLLEGRQMLNAMAGNQKGFVNHPATQMWKGHEHRFLDYLNEVATEMMNRNIQWEKNHESIVQLFDNHFLDSSYEDPYWWRGDSKQRIITTHRANLYLKDPEYYAAYVAESIEYQQTLDTNPTELVCCANRRRVPGKTGLQPCGYYWPAHVRIDK